MVIILISTKFELSPEQWVSRLARLHNVQLAELELLDDCYEGGQPLESLLNVHAGLTRILLPEGGEIIRPPPAHR